MPQEATAPRRAASTRTGLCVTASERAHQNPRANAQQQPWQSIRKRAAARPQNSAKFAEDREMLTLRLQARGHLDTAPDLEINEPTTAAHRPPQGDAKLARRIAASELLSDTGN